MGVRICPRPLINMPSAGMHMLHSHCVRVFFYVRVMAFYQFYIRLAANLLHTQAQDTHNQRENQLPPRANADKTPKGCKKVKGHL